MDAALDTSCIDIYSCQAGIIIVLGYRMGSEVSAKRKGCQGTGAVRRSIRYPT